MGHYDAHGVVVLKSVLSIALPVMLSSILLYAKKWKLLSLCDRFVQWDALLDEDQVDTHHCSTFVYDIKHVHKKFYFWHAMDFTSKLCHP